MMSKSLSCKLVLDEARRNLWALALSLLGFLFALPIPVAMLIQSAIQSAQELDVAWEEMLADASSSVQNMLANDFSRLGMMVMALLCGIALFRFLHDRRQVDFYHALPIQREKLYFVKFSAGLLLVLPAYFAALLAAVAVTVGMGFGSCIVWPQLLQRAGIDLIAFFVVYGIAVLCTVFCGNTLFAAALTFWVMVCGTIINEVYVELARLFYPAYSSWGYFLPFMASPMLGFMQSSHFGNGEWRRYLVMYAAVGMAALVLSFVLFCRRKSERAGTAVAFAPFRLPLKLFTCPVVGLGFGCCLVEVMGYRNSGMVWLLLLTAVGAAVCHCVMEVIYSADFRAMFRNPVVLAVVTALSVALTLGLRADVFGYSRWVPSEGSVQWVSLNHIYCKTSGTDAFSQNEFSNAERDHLTDQAVKEAAIRLAERGTQHLDLCLTNSMGRKEIEQVESLAKENGTFEVILGFGLSGGRVKMRDYVIPATEENAALIQQITDSEAYIQSRSELQHYLQELEEMEEKRSSGGERVITLTDLLRDERIGILREESQIDAFIEALAADELQCTSALLSKESPVVTVQLGYEREDLPRYYYSYSMNVYPSFQRTMALIEEYMDFQPAALRVEEIERIEVNDSRTRQASAASAEGDGSPKAEVIDANYRNDVTAEAREDSVRRTTDPEMMERLLRDAAPLTDRGQLWMVVNQRVVLTVQLVNGNRISLTYPADKVPEDALTELFGAPINQ